MGEPLVNDAGPIPPHSIEAEQSVLGGMLVDAGAVYRAAALLTERMFYRERHRPLFRGILAVHEQHGTTDDVVLCDYLEAVGDLEAVGGKAYIAELWDYVPTAANIEHHARIVAAKARERQLATYGAALHLQPGDGSILAALQSVPPPDADRNRFRFITDEELEDMPEVPALAGDVFFRNTLAVMAGPPGAGKSFAALALANSIQTGTPWCGKSVPEAGQVVYVAASEGVAGLGSRNRAWRKANSYFGGTGVRFVTEPVILTDPNEVTRFIHALRTLPDPPVLVVLDTVARCYVGDENATEVMSSFVAGADRIRAEFGCTVLGVHHTNASGERERGNTALRGASDTFVFVKKDSDRVTLTCEKQKDAHPFRKLQLRLVPVGDSLALLTTDAAPQLRPDELSEKQAEILALLRSHFLGDGATVSQWLKVSGSPESTFYDARTVLVRSGYVKEPATQRGGLYTLTPAGERFLTTYSGHTPALTAA